MPRTKKSETTLSQLKMERLKNHLSDVEHVITNWISELNLPNPFAWLESREAIKFETEKADMPVRVSLGGGSDIPRDDQRIQWALRTIYMPSTEQDPITNHILRKHLRKRSLWTYHTQWEQRLKHVTELAPAARDKLSQIVKPYKGNWDTTEDYEGIVLEKALELAIGQEGIGHYWQKPGFSSGVWLDDILIEKSAPTEEVKQVGSQHRKLVEEIAQSEEMRSVAVEWVEVIKLQDKMQQLAINTLKSSDILYQCKFCRRLW